MTKNDELVAALMQNYRTAAIDAADLAMLTYVDKLARTPFAIVQDDVDKLRDMGFSNAAVLDICQVAAYYAFVNRLADGLGVELE